MSFIPSGHSLVDILTDTDGGNYNAVGSWFLGPRGENAAFLMETLSKALDAHIRGRIDYYPEDLSPIHPTMIASNSYQKNLWKLQELVVQLGPLLAQHSLPFWNPRYNAHMHMDTSMPGIVGYFTAMLSNPNNAGIESSPLTTVIEIIVGIQLCKLVGYNVPPSEEDPVGWGHITCSGSIANLESMWAARNLKFYPLSLRLAMKNELSFISDTFTVPTCTQLPGDGTAPKLLRDFSTWELLNITPFNILDIPSRLLKEYGISSTFLKATLKPYLAQTRGKDQLESEFGLQPMVYFVSATMHYSWPKGAAITGIGSQNVIPVNVDHSARMDPADLRRHLQACLDAKDDEGKPSPKAVYAVVAILGSTEHGACDPLKDILDIREEFRQKGLSFVVHGDGAWGTYFLATIPRNVTDRVIYLSRHTGLNWPDYLDVMMDTFVPTFPLKPKTIESLTHLRFCDSITVDPHKSGYIQYPAGGLLYRDQRMRYLLTWTSPIVFRSDEPESIGVYGAEGSKPGAAAVATWFSHTVIGLGPDGYGQLLGEALFGGVKMHAHLATMSTSASEFVVRPLNLLPAEEAGGSEADVEAQKELIRRKVLRVPHRELVKDKETWKLMLQIGSDLSINAFAVNFKLDGQVNEDIVEANDLNQRIFKRLSVSDHKSTLNDKPLILTSTVLSQPQYGNCLTNFKERLGLKGPQDLYTLVNVVMSPFTTVHDLMSDIVSDLKKVILEESKVSVFRNTLTNDLLTFLMQGPSPDVDSQPLFLVHLAMFNMENFRLQLIITGTLENEAFRKYQNARSRNPTATYLLVTKAATTLSKILSSKAFEAVIESSSADGNVLRIAEGMFTDIKVVAQHKLHTAYLQPYPARTMPFYVYGTEDQVHIDHVYTASPNIQLSAERVTIDNLNNDWGTRPLMYAHLPLPESAMQPFPQNFRLATSSHFFFRAGTRFDNVILSRDLDSKHVIMTTAITLGENIFVDADLLNDKPVPVDPAEPSQGGCSTSKSLISNGRSLRILRRNLPQVVPPPSKKYFDIIRNLESIVNSPVGACNSNQPFQNGLLK